VGSIDRSVVSHAPLTGVQRAVAGAQLGGERLDAPPRLEHEGRAVNFGRRRLSAIIHGYAR
jgi:hypothetical protein